MSEAALSNNDIHYNFVVIGRVVPPFTPIL